MSRYASLPGILGIGVLEYGGIGDWRGMENGTNSVVAVMFYFLEK